MDDDRQPGVPGPASPADVTLYDDERVRRRQAVDYARASVRLSGFVLDPEVEVLNRRYIDGRLTGEQHAQAIRLAAGLAPQDGLLPTQR